MVASDSYLHNQSSIVQVVGLAPLSSLYKVLRSLEGGILSDSRYLAMVRRAT